MADEDSEPEVFEIEDFTTASEWERFIAKLEEIIRSWHLENSQKKGLTKKDNVVNKSEEFKKQNDAAIACQDKISELEAEWLIESKQLYFADFSFTLSHHKLKGDNVKDTSASSAPDDNDGPSKAVMDMFDIEFDFPSRAHCISRWYGLKEFLILSPSNPNEDINTESRSKLLLSSVSIALSNTRCHIPGFVQIQQRWQRLFIGTCISNGFTSNFEMARLRNTPPQCSHLSGLLDIFKEKLAIPSRLIPPIMTSIRFTYILNWPEDEWVQEPPDFSTAFGSQVGYLNLSRQPFGPLQEPVSELHLATTWPCLSEETFVDHAEYTDLDPIEAPQWSLRARTADKCISLLYDHLMAFIQICKKSESTAQIIRSLSKDQINIDSYGDITHALNRLTETTTFPNQKRESSNKKPANREQMKLKESPLPEDLLNKILLHMFPDSHEDLKQAEERQRILAEEQKQLENESKKDRFRKMKSAPEKSLLYLLTICLSIVNYGYGGIKAFAHLWHEFILELRYRYENNIVIPRLALGPPNLNYCLIHQKLQMLNHCIEKKKLHHEESSQLFSTNSSESSIRTTEGNEETPSKDIESNDNNERTVDFEIESDSDDEFFEAVEEQSISSETSSNIQIKNSKQNERAKDDDNSPSGSFIHSENDNQTNNTDERHGVLKESDMKLLKTGKTLCIPITQEQQVMTEDMLEEHTEIILKLAKSESGSKYLAQMQSLSLFSDIQAFKAANPGCMFEDFVRWYSPNDWIPGPETEREKEELRKMETEYQQLKNKADLMEVVGEEEIEGWDLDDDNEITEQELSSLIGKEQTENQSELLEEGHLSVRMRIPGNIWVETWQTALPVAARRQKRLFDYTKEAEKVLHFLANLKPCEISSLLFPVFIHTAIDRILLEEESSRSRISNILNGIIHSTSRLVQGHKDDISKMMNISRQLQISELAISRIQFLEKQFSKLAKISENKDCDENLKDFISKLLSTSEVRIEDGSRGKIGKIIQKLIENNQQVKNVTMEDSSRKSLSEVIKERHHKKVTFPNPAGREYILRTKINKPRQCSRQSPQRLFTVITPDEFRLAAVFSQDTTFI